jgi:hypothetical protein
MKEQHKALAQQDRGIETISKSIHPQEKCFANSMCGIGDIDSNI